MAIASAIEERGWVRVFDERGWRLCAIPITRTDRLVGWTAKTFSVAGSGWVRIYDERGIVLSSFQG
jgi:hypothetical protein